MNPLIVRADGWMLAYERRAHRPASVARARRLITYLAGVIGPDDAREIQRRRLRRLMRWAYARSPHYGQWMREHGLRPGRVRSADDLREMPITDGTQLAESERFLCVPPDAVAASFLSSGTTGRPKRIDLSYADVQLTANAGATGLGIFGPPPQRALIAMPMTHGLWVGWRQTMWVLERGGAMVVPVGAEDPAAVLEHLKHFRPDLLATSPTFASQITALARSSGYREPIERIILGSEAPADSQLRELEDYWSAGVHNSYGATELGVGFAQGQAGRRAIQFNELHVLAEIVDPQTGQPADEGELLYTTLTRQAMPLIRYRSGDRARWADAEPTGVPFRPVELLGRSDEMLILAGSKVSATVLAELARAAAGSDRRLAIHTERFNGTIRLLLRVEGSIPVEQLRQAICRKYPRLIDHLAGGRVELAIEENADLAGQAKSLVVRPRDGEAVGR